MDAKQNHTKLYPLFIRQQQQVTRTLQHGGVDDHNHHQNDIASTPWGKLLQGTTVARFKEDFPSGHRARDFLNECNADEDDDSDDDIPLSMLADITESNLEIVQSDQHQPNKRKRSEEGEAFLAGREDSVKITWDSTRKDHPKRGHCQERVSSSFDQRNNARHEEQQSPHQSEDPPETVVEDTRNDAHEGNKEPFCDRVSLSPCTKASSLPIRSRGRLCSDSAMDFVVSFDEPGCRTTKNILVRLWDRSTHGCLLHKTAGFGGMSNQIFHSKRSVQLEQSLATVDECPTWMLPSKWKIPSWVALAQPIEFEYSSKNKNVDHMVWDEMGVLLAVARDATISIYDWDMVRAADLHGRRDRSRQCRESEWKIEPIIQFRAASPVTKLVWNPFHPDELAVCLR
jgi:hypothetical protein